MKITHPLFMLLCFISLITSCKKDNIEFENEYDKSYKAWKNFKSMSNNTYRYKTFNASMFGLPSETIITVRNGLVIERSYTEKRTDYKTGNVEIINSWIENESQLNSHNYGAPTLTLDQVYQKAKSEWLLVRKNANTYFENENDKMISICGYVENGCQDDCFIGINIAFIEKIN